jgi:hypothetical protein
VDDPTGAVGLGSDNETTQRDLADAREEIVAVNEVLAAMVRSASDLDPVLDTILGSRTIMGAPMVRGGDVIGVLQVWRTEVREFDERAITSLTSFAAAADSERSSRSQ